MSGLEHDKHSPKRSLEVRMKKPRIKIVVVNHDHMQHFRMHIIIELDPALAVTGTISSTSADTSLRRSSLSYEKSSRVLVPHAAGW